MKDTCYYCRRLSHMNSSRTLFNLERPSGMKNGAKKQGRTAVVVIAVFSPEIMATTVFPMVTIQDSTTPYGKEKHVIYQQAHSTHANAPQHYTRR